MRYFSTSIEIPEPTDATIRVDSAEQTSLVNGTPVTRRCTRTLIVRDKGDRINLEMQDTTFKPAPVGEPTPLSAAITLTTILNGIITSQHTVEWTADERDQ